MENIELSEESRKYIELHKPFTWGDLWTVKCLGKTFIVNNCGMKLVAREDEDLEKIIFDIEKKTVSVKVKNPILSEKAPRVLDLNSNIDFFEALRSNIEAILTSIDSKFTVVTPNEDRTVFKVS